MARTKKHPGTIEPRGGSFRITLYIDGVRHRFNEKLADRKAAETFARDKHEELTRKAQRTRSGLPGETTFSELLEMYKRDELPTLSAGTQRAYKDSLDPIERYFVTELADPTLEKIHARHVRTYLSWRRTQRRAGKHQKAGSEPVGNRTLQKDRAVLHRMFEFADQLELRDGNPVSRVEQPKADSRSPVLLSADQVEALLTACEPRPMLALYALVLLETGARCQSEALHLQWSDVDLVDGFIEIRSGREGHRTKSGKSRFVPMTPRLTAAMRSHFARYRFASYDGKASPWVFHHLVSKYKCKAGERIKSLRHSFNEAAAEAGIPDEFHQHDLRHLRATSWLAAGGNVAHVKEALGHSDLRTTMIYQHLSKQHLKSLVQLEQPRVETPAAETA